MGTDRRLEGTRHARRTPADDATRSRPLCRILERLKLTDGHCPVLNSPEGHPGDSRGHHWRSNRRPVNRIIEEGGHKRIENDGELSGYKRRHRILRFADNNFGSVLEDEGGMGVQREMEQAE